uniref:Uncharacterized protein n=1 Tax=Knipowitschia caucasica TaxID=637954 RepID=A0AAV2KT24_KNICA
MNCGLFIASDLTRLLRPIEAEICVLTVIPGALVIDEAVSGAKVKAAAVPPGHTEETEKLAPGVRPSSRSLLYPPWVLSGSQAGEARHRSGS